MQGGQGLSRRALFGAGLGRVLDARFAHEDEAGRRREHQPPTSFPGWGEGDADGLGGRLEPVATALLAACDVRPAMRVLVAGAGDGVLARAAARRGAEVTAVEASEERVERGRALCADAGLDVAWVVGPLSKMPVEEARHEAVVSLFGAAYADDPRALAAQLTRAARPGAPIAFTAWQGLIAELLRVVGPGAARSRRWARYETAYLHFFDFPELDVRDCALQLRFDSVDEAIEVLAAPAGAIGAEERVRQALPRLLAGQHQPQGGGFLVQVAHAMVFACRP
ncbi:MAG: class I SAM-dependent methyltransferase [Chloroflexota bacterium]|nr:class I SAM-dependent methyltransferase [Chloroflexota bacterium]